MVFSCGFELHFPNDGQCCTSFSCVVDCPSIFGGIVEECFLESFVHFGIRLVVLWCWLVGMNEELCY